MNKNTDEVKFYEKNYRKLWAMHEFNMAFIRSLSLIRSKYSSDLPLKATTLEEAVQKRKEFINVLSQENIRYLKSTGTQEIIAVLTMVNEMQKPLSYKKKVALALFYDIPTMRFFTDIKNLMEEFGYQKEWLPYLALYVITDYITAPSVDLSDIPPDSIKEQFEIYKLNLKKEIQHEHLRKQGIKTTTRDENATVDTIASLDKDTELLPEKLQGLIHGYADLGDELWGEINEEDFPDEKLSQEEDRRINTVKVAIHNFNKSKYFVDKIPPEQAERIKKLFS